MGVVARDVAELFALGWSIFALDPPPTASALFEAFLFFVGIVDVYRIVFRTATCAVLVVSALHRLFGEIVFLGYELSYIVKPA